MLEEGRSSKLGEEDKRDQEWGFVGGPSGFAEKSPARMDILMPASGYQGSDHSSVDLRRWASAFSGAMAAIG